MGEQRFKVGDWVRVKDNRGAPRDYKVGEVRQVTKIDDDIVRCGPAGMFDYRFEPWQPRVGERVRVNFAGWEGEGEVTDEEKYGIALVKMKEGTYAGTEGGFLARDLKPILTATATPEQPATLKIEAGKFYKTRDGRKVGPMTNDGDLYYPWDGEIDGESRCFTKDGFYWQNEQNNQTDLVAEWANEPASKANASNDNAQPNFKVGDAIRHKALRHEGVVTAVIDERTVRTHWTKEGWGATDPIDEIELITPTSRATTTTIVALIENGQPKPSSTPHVHASTGAAEKEAKRLAAKFKGKQFGVFTLTTTHEEAAPVYDHKWQNLAALGLKIDAIKELRAVAGLTLKGAKDAVEAWIEYENAA